MQARHSALVTLEVLEDLCAFMREQANQERLRAVEAGTLPLPLPTGDPAVDGKSPSPAGELHTFDEWKALGFSVNKGQKSCARNRDGKAVFAANQVQKSAGFTVFSSYKPSKSEPPSDPPEPEPLDEIPF